MGKELFPVSWLPMVGPLVLANAVFALVSGANWSIGTTSSFGQSIEGNWVNSLLREFCRDFHGIAVRLRGCSRQHFCGSVW
jgi:hypothetical protein